MFATQEAIFTTTQYYVQLLEEGAWGKKMNEYRILVVKPGGQRSRRKQEDNFRVECAERKWLRME
jgi:hypothetical protein